MAFHYLRDATFTSVNAYQGQWAHRTALMYHFMRTAGFLNIWECDGDVGTVLNPNHVDDGNMEEAGVAKYATVGAGAAIVKETAIYDTGLQSLRITAGAISEGARTVALLSLQAIVSRSFDAGDALTGPVNEIMTLVDDDAPFTTNMIGSALTITGLAAANNGTFTLKKYNSTSSVTYENPTGVADAAPSVLASYTVNPKYEIIVRARNNSGHSWNVDVDPGTAVYGTVGTIPDNGGVWTTYHFTFLRSGAGSCYVRFVDSVGAGELYVDSMHVFRSCFEYCRYNLIGDGATGNFPADGQLVNPDLFQTASYTFTAKDIGKWVFVWDPTNPTNSGGYKIIAIVGAAAQVDLRSGTAAFVNVGPGLTWRVVEIEEFFKYSAAGSAAEYVRTSGVGLQSPHASGWRLILRHSFMPVLGNVGTTVIWAAPEDTEIDPSSGIFNTARGPSTHRNRQDPYTYITTSSSLPQHGTSIPYTTVVGCVTRTFVMLDDTKAFVNVVHAEGTTGKNGAFSAGYVGADADHPGIEEFVLMAKFNHSNSDPETDPASLLTSFWNGNTVFSPTGEAVLAHQGIHGIGTGVACMYNQSNFGDNPWSAEEVLWYPIIIRDPTGDIGCPSMREATANGMRMCRNNMPVMATFDSNNYFHFGSGYCWVWNGFATIP